MYIVLKSSTFFERYKEILIPGEFKFITKAYRASDKSVAVFLKENDYDCYFQLPNYQTNKVPESRKDIYLLRKNTVKNMTGLEETADGRKKVPIKFLETWKNPYKDSDRIEISETQEEEIDEIKLDEVEIKLDESNTKEKIKETKLQKLKRIVSEADENLEKVTTINDRLKKLIEKLLKAEEDAIEILKTIDYAEDTN